MNVFLSYTYQDSSLAKAIAAALESCGHEVWTDEQVLPGDNWAELTSKALNESDAMVVLITPDALKATTVQREIEYALGNKQFKNRLIPVYVGDRTVLDENQIPWILRSLRQIEMPNPENTDKAAGEITRLLANAS